MAPAIVICAYRGGPGDQAVWGDLRVCLASVAAYAGELEVVVAWDGPCAPGDLPLNPRCRLFERPAGMTSQAAFDWAVQHTDAEEVVNVSDDIVLRPDTVELLLADVAFLREQGFEPGIVACRSNFAPGPQNVRAANGGTWAGNVGGYDSEGQIVQAERVSPFCAYLDREAIEIIGGPELEWYSDDLACFDLARLGRTNWVSRAYVHHIGMRSSIEGLAACERLNADALGWLAANRPDFLAHLEAAQRA